MHNMKAMREKVQALHVLVVDDEKAVLSGSLQFMKKFFLNVDSAVNGEDAINKFHNNGPYDVIITDIKMPKKSGWDLIQTIRATDSNVYIAAMTASPELGTDELIALCDIYLRKPINIDHMTQILEQLCNRKISDD